MINGKNKGTDFERKIAKLLQEWSGYEFHRTPMSGALHWNNDTRVVSDIVPSQELVDKGWPFSIECKKVEAPWEINNFIDGNAITIKEHWNQCTDDAKREHLIPMLIFNKNRRDVYIMITKETFENLNISPDSYINLIQSKQNLIIMKFKDFLSLITVDKLLSKNLLNT